MNDKEVKDALIARDVRLANIIESIENILNIIGDVEWDDSYLLKHSDVESVPSLSQPKELLQVAIDVLNKSIEKGGELYDRT